MTEEDKAIGRNTSSRMAQAGRLRVTLLGTAGIIMSVPGFLAGIFIAVIAIAMMLLVNSRMRQVERVKPT